MSWNYRVVKMDYKVEDVDWYEVREVFYNDDDGEVRSYSSRAVSLSGECVQDIKDDIALIRDAFKKPILLERDLKKLKRCADKEEQRRMKTFTIGKSTKGSENE